MAGFVEFLAEHSGGPVTAGVLKSLRPADVRAFITVRRSKGLGPRGVQRAMAALRSFYRHLERANLANSTAVQAVRSPKIPHTLPRPLSERDAMRVIGEAGEEGRKWLAARNVALITLLYGTGLRISEALSLKRSDAVLGEKLYDHWQGQQRENCTGHRCRSRSRHDLHPVLPVRSGQERCSLSVTKRRTDDAPRSATFDAAIEVASRPLPNCDFCMQCDIRSPRICCKTAATFAWFRNSLGMLRFPQPKNTLKWKSGAS